MKPHYAFFGAALLLAACGGASDTDIGGGGTDGGGGGGDIPDFVDPGELPVTGESFCGSFTCSGEITNIAYNATDDELYLTGLPFDDQQLGGEYLRIGTSNGFAIYQNDNPSIFARYLAIHQSSVGDAITVGVAAASGYQDYGYSGAWYQLNDLTTNIPVGNTEDSFVAYSGTYAGLMSYLGQTGLDRTVGLLNLEVDFTDSKLRGTISNRSIDTKGDTVLSPGDFYLDAPTITGAEDDIALNTIVLKDTDITDGAFSGVASSFEGAEDVETGTYQGFFGGTDANVVGGLVQVFNPDFTDAEDEDTPVTSRDLGVFVGESTPLTDPD